MGLLDIFHNRNSILGMNKRNLHYIRKYNSTSAKDIADNKILTKKILSAADIPTPKLIAEIHNSRELYNFDFNSLPNSFVLKPVFGLEGNGIDIFFNRAKDGGWIRADKSRAYPSDLFVQMSDILNGRFSLFQQPDIVMIEERVKSHKAFKPYTYKGVPDIRIIVHNNIPVMGMLRLPTKDSGGKANLAIGAIGAGIDMATGVTTTAIYGKAGEIDYIPGTNIHVSGFKIPYWNKILTYAVEAQKATQLNYAAIDFLIDRDNGPLIVELNARPGLSLQLANMDGQRWRLKKANGLKVKSTAKGIRLGRDLFGGEIEEEVEILTGKEVIGLREEVTLVGLNAKEIKVMSKVDTGADSSSMDLELAKELGYDAVVKLAESLPTDISNRDAGWQMTKDIHDKFVKNQQEQQNYPGLCDVYLIKSSHGFSVRPVIELSATIQDRLVQMKVNLINRSHLGSKMILGHKSLKNFLIDPVKK